MRLRSFGFGCYINSTFGGVLGYADDVTLISPNIRGTKQLIYRYVKLMPMNMI